jgi:hypothetical protein
MSPLLDTVIVELAELYLADEPALAGRAGELAHCIRDAIEDWAEAARDEAEEAGKE